MKRRKYRKLAKKKQKKERNKNKVAHFQPVKPKGQGHVPNYKPAIEYLSGYSENINALSNEINVLSSAAYQPPD